MRTIWDNCWMCGGCCGLGKARTCMRELGRPSGTRSGFSSGDPALKRWAKLPLRGLAHFPFTPTTACAVGFILSAPRGCPVVSLQLAVREFLVSPCFPAAIGFRDACGRLPSRPRASARQSQRIPSRSPERCIAATRRSEDGRGMQGLPDRAEASPQTISGRRNIRSGEITGDCDATALATSSRGPAAACGCLHRP
jgi:hypothetical protein